MRTTKPISTISFNTPAYLNLKLTELTKAGKISFWAYILHYPEDDEGGKKQHLHVYIEPSKLVQTDDIREYLKEYDPDHPETPKGSISFQTSNFGNWYMYSLHDSRYLSSKGQSRRYHYKHSDMVTSDKDDLNYKAKMIDLLSLSPYAAMQEAIENGVTMSEYFARGTIPMQQVAQFQRAWQLLADNRTERNGRPGHESEYHVSGENIVNKTTGEVNSTPQWEIVTDDEEIGI